MANDIPHWVGDVPDPRRPNWRALSPWQKAFGMLAISAAGGLALAGLVTIAGLSVRLFVWAAGLGACK